MTTSPAPLTPAECNLQDFAFMPLDVRRLLTSETWVLGTGDERAAAMCLWLESWHQIPAASLPNNPRMLAHLAQATKWPKVQEQALRGWVLCSDGRLYHPVVAEKALEAWVEKLLNSISGATGNAKRWGIAVDVATAQGQFQCAISLLRNIAPQSKTLKKKAVLTVAAGSPPDSPPESSGDRKGQGQGQGNLSGTDVPGGAAAGKPAKTPEEMAKAELWRAAVSLLDGQGMPEPQARAFFGKLSKDFPDGTTVADALGNCIATQPADARAWLTAECQRIAGTRKPTRRPTSHTGLADKNYSEGIQADGTLV